MLTSIGSLLYTILFYRVKVFLGRSAVFQCLADHDKQNGNNSRGCRYRYNGSPVCRRKTGNVKFAALGTLQMREHLNNVIYHGSCGNKSRDYAHGRCMYAGICANQPAKLFLSEIYDRAYIRAADTAKIMASGSI